MRLVTLLLCASLTAVAFASPGDEHLQRYFQSQVAQISRHALERMQDKTDWLAHRDEYRRQLAEMLGLWPEPARTPLQPVITGRLETSAFTVEKIQFQSRPGLYVTADLYVPKGLTEPAPAILYVCGHAAVKANGVSYGNKTAYEHHAAWFASNGYVCLVPDTLQLGEIEGIHHGLYREKMWWWLSRGYTPAGVEAWNAIRCLDYLQSRKEVDPNRLGMTGRSGGGAYTWYTAALDERVKVAVPVAGMTDLQNQVVDGAIEGHCDCMFMTNTYRWDFPMVAALIAPRPLLIGNSDKDPLFPLDGVERLHDAVRDVYRHYGAEKNLGLLIDEGPHADTQELQVGAFRWFNRFLKNDRSPIDHIAPQRPFEAAQLAVFPPHGTPGDQINTKVQELFIPLAETPAAPKSEADWNRQRDVWLDGLRKRTFAGWPTREETPALEPKQVYRQNAKDGSLTVTEFTSQVEVPLRLYVAQPASAKPDAPIVLHVSDAPDLEDQVRKAFDAHTEPQPDEIAIWFAPRGLGPDAWTGDERKLTHVRRRFWLLGQTDDGMRVWDVRRAIAAIRYGFDSDGHRPIRITASGRMAGVALYASLFEPNVAGLDLTALPPSHRQGPDLLNVRKTLDTPAAVAMAAERCRVHLLDTNASDWTFATECVHNLPWHDRLTVNEPAH